MNNQLIMESTEPIPCRIFVGGFDEKTTEAELHQTFQIYGPILIINIVRDKLNRSYGFVTFQYEESARRALCQQCAIYIRGRKLRLSPAFLKNKSRPTYRCVAIF